MDTKKNENKNVNYYLGLDMGTDSVGWAVTDENYNLLQFKRKALWGVRLFDSANTAEERRLFRTSRRRNDRKKQRISLLQELISEEISKVDPGFYLRMKESKFLVDDKDERERQPNTLFNDPSYSDQNYHEEFPTIFHLRKALMEGENKYDIRLYYLAIHHIIKHRGHFLFEGQELNSTLSFPQIFSELRNYLLDEYELDLQCNSIDEVEKIISDRSINKTEKKKKLNNCFSCTTKMEKAIATALSGGTVSLSDLFEDEDLAEGDLTKFSFTDSTYEDKVSELESILNERMYLVNKLKAIYDWGILTNIIGDNSYLSDAKVEIYEKHKKDLSLLKKVIKDLPDGKNIYNSFFRDEDSQKNNYPKYIGASNTGGKKDTSQEELCKELEKILKDAEIVSKEAKYIAEEIENRTLLPKQVSKDNSVIPYQLHLSELDLILNNMGVHYPSILEENDSGWSIKEKILKLFTFRIPYYVGPLNDAHSNKEDWTKGNCWVVKKSQDKIFPWNFDEIVDKDASAERFIRRMTNKCSYLLGADVLPKNSLLYSEFTLLNELNNLKVNGEPISVELKKKIYQEVFQKGIIKGKVTLKKLKEYLYTEGNIDRDAELSGIDIDFKSSLKSYNDFKNILGDKLDNNKQVVEEIIQSIVLFSDDKKLLESNIRKKYSKILDEQEILEITKLAGKYKDWGRLSRELLTDIEDTGATNKDTGEVMNIITAMRETNDNLMELLSSKYGFSEAINTYNNKVGDTSEEKITYDIVDDTYASPSVKRMIWQSLLLVKEIKKVMGCEPKKIFLETTRSDGTKGDAGRKSSRKNYLIDLYKNCSEDGLNFKGDKNEWIENIESHSDSELRGKRLFLYTIQNSKCMYSGEPIVLKDLNNKELYEIDHIIPQSKTKDNSFDNMVLVKKKCNQDKKDEYPIEPEVQKKMKEFWTFLKKNKFLSEEKYNRLTRKSKLTADELAGFINRQLVETSQATKLTAQILKKTNPNSKIVYSKAKNVSDFRNGNNGTGNDTHKAVKFTKVREINDYHHAKDAYLNIVVGNAYDVKFTQNAFNFIKKDSDIHYNLEKMFNWDIERNGEIAWQRGKNGTIKTVEEVMMKNNILFTSYVTEKKGKLFDRMPVKKGETEGKVPLKGADPRMDVSKYGGYNNVYGAYFMLVESDGKKGIRERSLEFVPLMLAQSIKDKQDLIDYCINIGLKNPDVRVDKIKINSLIKVNGVPMHITGRSRKQILLKNAVQLVIGNREEVYLKKLFNFLNKRDEKRKYKIDLLAEERDGLTTKENIEVYNILMDKVNNSIYSKVMAMPIDVINNGKDIFVNLSIEKQADTLREIIKLFQCTKDTSDLKKIGGASSAGESRISKRINKYKTVELINQSITGLFINRIDLKTI